MEAVDFHCEDDVFTTLATEGFVVVNLDTFDADAFDLVCAGCFDNCG